MFYFVYLQCTVTNHKTTFRKLNDIHCPDPPPPTLIRNHHMISPLYLELVLGTGAVGAQLAHPDAELPQRPHHRVVGRLKGGRFEVDVKQQVPVFRVA